MRSKAFLVLSICLLVFSSILAAAEYRTRVVMTEKSAATFYVPAEITGYGSVELMVDTGSGYMTINENTLSILQHNGHARYVKQLQGVLADGTELIVPVYAISAINIGDNCLIKDVEAAVFPGNSRQILGLSALRKTAPFVFSVDPPELMLSYCADAPVVAGEVAANGLD